MSRSIGVFPGTCREVAGGAPSPAFHVKSRGRDRERMSFRAKIRVAYIQYPRRCKLFESVLQKISTYLLQGLPEDVT